MFIAFEGPDNTGKTYDAAHLASSGVAVHEIDKATYEQDLLDYAGEPDLVVTYDRIIWLGHMIYRLGMPDHEWNDPKVRVVFAMPDTHLVIKLHRPDHAMNINDELYAAGKVARVNPMYYYFGDFLLNLNRVRNYELFKSVSIIEVAHNQETGEFSQRLRAHDSPAIGDTRAAERAIARLVDSPDSLLDFLRYVDQQTLSRR